MDVAGSAEGWRVERRRGSAEELHGLAWPEPVRPTVWLLDVQRPALVLGSTQARGLVDGDGLATRGIEVTTRRTGGGAVLLRPGENVWIDVLIPRGDPRWDDDVSRSFDWIGRAWAAALSDLGLDAQVHPGGLVCGPFGRLVCFAGLGSGEVTVAGAKAVGLSQRRTRAGARFQCLVHRQWDPAPLVAIAGVDPGALPPVAVVDLPRPVIEAAVLARLSVG